MKKFHICHIITRLDVGGAAENTLRSVCGLDPERYRVSLIYGRTDNPLQSWLDRAKDCGVELISLPDLLREIRLGKDLSVFFHLRRLLKQLKPDLVHTHSSKAGVLGRWAARTCKVPSIVHTPHGHIFYGYYSKLGSAFFRWVEKITVRFTDRMVGLTELEVRQHLEAGIGRKDQYAVIHSGVDVERFTGVSVDRKSLRERFRVPKDAICIGSAGRLVSVKNFSLLLDALEILNEKQPDRYHLVILGEGGQRGILLHKSMELGVQDAFYLPGWFENMENYYPAFDIFALSSLNEGMGRVLVEAMAAGVPVVATEVGGVPELLQDGKAGLLCKSKDAQSMAEAIEKLANSPELRKKLAGQGRTRAQDYTSAAMIEKLDQLYGELLK